MQDKSVRSVLSLNTDDSAIGNVTEQASSLYVPMIRLEQARDYYRVSVVMPPVKYRKNWAVFDRGRLRVSIPPVSYRDKGASKPGFLRWISLPDDIDQRVCPIVDYSCGCLRILVARRGWQV